jgi:hypothetical protein
MKHEVSNPGPVWLRRLRWFWRGVTDHNYRQLCQRCGFTGQAHLGYEGTCRRFKG